MKNDQARALLHPVSASSAPVDVYAEAPLPTRHGLLRVYVFRERAAGGLACVRYRCA